MARFSEEIVNGASGFCVKAWRTLVYVPDVWAHHEEGEDHEGLGFSDFFTFAFVLSSFLRDLRVLRGGDFSTGNQNS